MDQEKIHILYLDDEENNLMSFKAAFRRDFKIFTTTSANEAVQILNDNDIHIVISDQKMPNLSGVEFFELIIKDFPDPVRMLLTGYADIEAVIDAINKGQIYRYVAKPWNEQDLKMTIDNAFEIYKSRKEIKQKNIELEKAYNELEKFVYSASHDLRAPLVSILGVLKMARIEGVEGPAGEYFGMIETSVTRLDNFVKNIINYYQNLKKGEILSDIKLDFVLDEVFEHYKFYEGASRIDFQRSCSQEGIVKLDELRLKMILNNLVSNAIKYSDPNEDAPYFKIDIVANSETVNIVVEDNGIGIPREALPKVFEMFFRAHEEKMGSGIGLYIAKEATEKMDGKILVSSEPKQGTRFEVTLPNRNDN